MQSIGQIVRDHEEEVWVVGSLLVSLLVWEGVVRLKLITNTFLPAPSAIFRAAVSLYTGGDIREHLAASGSAFAVGLGLAVGVGVLLGVAIGWSPRLDAVLAPHLAAFYEIGRAHV